MGKISPVSAKYIIYANIETDGIVDKPDVIGAIFGQTEGLLGADLELRELQRSGRIGRIEVNIETRTGKSRGTIVIPSSMDKAETSIIGAALEIIQRIGPCNARLKVSNIEDVRISKRTFVIERAKELLKQLMDTSMPDSQELADEVSYSIRVMEIQEWGRDRLPAGPSIDESDDVLVVEGRADVLNLLKHGIKNAIAMNGTSVPKSIADLSREKVMTAFVDGDRGGDLIIKELLTVAEIDFVTKAPDGKEVEELTKKELHKALRSKVSPEQIKHDMDRRGNHAPSQPRSQPSSGGPSAGKPSQSGSASRTPSSSRPPQREPQRRKASSQELESFRTMLEDLVGTRGAYILDEKLSILGKVPVSELASTLKSLSSGVYAIVFDGVIDLELLKVAERSNVSFLVGMESKVRPSGPVEVLTQDALSA
ncbi:hypothetical protein COY28_04300 [Candidatus Woesearchaeota archaeon CG_4_10_14_0_2_um_filter_57_5]|nr:MAG: hypothetical protein AUJ68_01370 [Candidatus Woesearchaeota archaeon CG1_02_57_44]PIN68575.1 MAG: hypothetical protein COV94_04005 [Candidatus Woesearchaeota archaeon CG11_big_fil_rev_8_21_14_0_20_57_5]PIZ52740.1 MAG: hypothetical protein COY28_04300 [Candidatus Woesearchaeota archaeon CG_4_10_14_0_2_um_filter_57_5]